MIVTIASEILNYGPKTVVFIGTMVQICFLPAER